MVCKKKSKFTYVINYWHVYSYLSLIFFLEVLFFKCNNVKFRNEDTDEYIISIYIFMRNNIQTEKGAKRFKELL